MFVISLDIKNYYFKSDSLALKFDSTYTKIGST